MSIDYTKPQIKYIIVERAEGPSESCGKPEICKTFAAADAILGRWSRTSPPVGGGYDKCDFYVLWSDSECYRGRYDIQRGVGVDIRAQILSYLTPSPDSVLRKMLSPEQIQAGEAWVAARNL